MARIDTLCSHCGRVVPRGTRCVCRPKRRTTKRDASRDMLEPWRKQYKSKEYQQNRAEALMLTDGQCNRCGVGIAKRTSSGWLMDGGEVHHIKPLCEGGTHEVSNLEPLCKRCHALADAARRRETKRL